MKINVDINNLKIIDKDQLESGEYNVTDLEFIFSPEYENLQKVAIFGCNLESEDPKYYKVILHDDKCIIPEEVLHKTGQIVIGCYAYEINGEELIRRYSPVPIKIIVEQGSFRDNFENVTPPTPSELEQIQAQINQIEAKIVIINNTLQIYENNFQTINEAINNINEKIDDIEGDIADTYSKQEIDDKFSEVNEALEDKVDTTVFEESQNEQDEKIAKAELILSQLPKVTGEGTNISLSPTIEYDLELGYKGDTTQETTAYINVGTWEQGSINGTTGANYIDVANIRTTDFIPVFPNILYNISRTIKTSYMNFRFYDSSKSFLGTQQTSGMVTTNMQENRMTSNIASMTMTINNTSVAYMRMTDNSNDLSTVYTISTSIPNPSYPSPINVVTGTQEVEICGKNILDFTKALYKNNSSISAPSDIQANSFSMTGKGTWGNEAFLYKLENNTNYTISATFKSTTNAKTGFSIYGNNELSVSNLTTITSNVNTTLTPNTETRISVSFNSGNYEYIAIRLWNNASGTAFSDNQTMTITNAQLELGSTATSYEPYTSQSYTLHLGDLELTKIGSYQDYIYYDNGKWYKYGAIGKAVLNGSESWVYNAVSQGSLFRNNTIMTNRKSDGTYSPYSNYYKGIPSDQASTRVNGTFYINPNLPYLDIMNDSFTNADDFKTWLSTHNTIVNYVLNTPTTTEITNETLLSDLEYIRNNAMSYSGTTNISSSGNLPIIVSASALKQLS